MIIQYTDIGREKWSAEIEYPDTNDPNTIAGYAYEEAGRHLISREFEAVFNSEENRGSISAGYHNVGSFRIK